MKDLLMMGSLAVAAFLTFIGMIVGVMTEASDLMMGFLIIALGLQVINACFWMLYLEYRTHKATKQQI